ncbi:MAG TPA: hypothetical protein VF699_12920 [Caulobacteraceae bacterium]|jgi:hypothetical protein
MPATPVPASAFFAGRSRRHYAVEPAGHWWRVISQEGEVARYRTRAAALEGAYGLAEAMRKLGLDSEVLLDPTPRAA